MSDRSSKSAFVRRFDVTWSAMRRAAVWQGVCWTFLAIVVGLAALAAADFRLELPWGMWATGLGVLAAAGLALAWTRVIAPIRWCSRPRTALEIEDRFPQLGQSVRTTVQFAGRPAETVSAEGVTPTLVRALEDDTELRVRPLDLNAVVPWTRLKVSAVIAAVPALLVVIASLRSWEWRTALARTLLSDRPYTELSVSPGNTRVELGQDAAISATVTGRVDRRVVLYSREADAPDSAWMESELSAKDAESADRFAAEFHAKIDKLARPIEYRVVAGPARSDTYRLDIRYPLAIESIRIALEPPAYTRIEPSTSEGGDVQAINGTKARFEITLDRAPAEASLVLADPEDKPKDPNDLEVHTLPLRIDGTKLETELTLTEDKLYSIVAQSTDGSRLADNRYRIEVRKDREPQISFDEPSEALEVHSLAEVLTRIRLRDDFGLTKAGIVFQVNNGEEHALLFKDFEQEGTNTASDGPVLPTTVAELEKILPLELFGLTQKDSVTYYAFAEDNLPDQPHRTQTDLRFIDIRPFKRIYKVGGT